MVMRQLLIPLVCLLLLIFAGGGLIYLAPFHYYITAMKKGIESDVLYVEKPAPYLLQRGKLNHLKDIDQQLKKERNFWRKFHFSNFEMVLPFYHPKLYLMPVVDYEIATDELNLGFSLVDGDRQSHFEVLFEKPYPFRLEMGRDKIFTLPYFSGHLLSLGQNEIFKKLFTEEILPLEQEKSFFRHYLTLRDLSTTELGQKLFIMRNRQLLFTKSYSESNYYPEKKLGKITLTSNDLDSQFSNEIFFFLERGVIYPFQVKTLKHSDEAAFYRDLFLSSLHFRPSHENSSIANYSIFRGLRYDEKAKPEGMSLLFIAWTHVSENKDFLREMIQFMERSEYRHLYIYPLYNFAHQRYGSSLSAREENAKTAQERMEIMIKREIAQELKKVMEEEISTEKKFDDIHERMDFFLQRARMQGLDNNSRKIPAGP